MIRIEMSSEELNILRYEKYHYPHPLIQRKYDVLLLKAHGLSTSQIARIFALTPNTIRNYLYEYLDGGIDNLKNIRYKGQPTSLLSHKNSIEDDFRMNPPASVAEAVDRIEKLTGIKRGLTQTRQFMKRIGLKFRKTAPVPAKADTKVQEDFKKNSSCPDSLRPPRGGAWCFS